MMVRNPHLDDLRASSDKKAAVQRLLGDDPSFIEDDMLMPHTENAGSIGDDAEFEVLGVDRVGETLVVRVLAFFQEEVWANGCAGTKAPEERRAEVEFVIDLSTGELSYERHWE